jgi:hypothetical protein
LAHKGRISRTIFPLGLQLPEWVKAGVLLVNDHAAVRSAVRPMLDSHPDFKVCGEAENGREVIEKADLT